MAQKTGTKKVVAKVQPTPKDGKIEMVNIFTTSYGYFRYFIRNIMTDGGIVKFRFVKNKENYSGKIAVAQNEVDKAKKVLAEYQKKNPDVKTMWQ